MADGAVMRGSFLVINLGPGIKSSRVSNPLSNGRSFEINTRNSFLFLRKKEKDDVRPTVYRPIASSGMGFTEKEWHDEDGETTSTRMQMKATQNNENFRRNERNNGDSPHLRGRLEVFWSTSNQYYNKRNTKESRCSNVYTNVGGRAEPARRADDSDGSFFLECQWRRSRLPPPG